MVTRPRQQAASLVAGLEALGAEVIAFATIRIAPPRDPVPLERAARAVREFDWVIFTSANGVERFLDALEAVGTGPEALADARVACIGPATAEVLAERGVRVDVVPENHVAEGLAEALRAHHVAGARVLMPRAAGARELLPEVLARRGAHVTDVEAYRSVPDTRGAEQVRARLAMPGGVDAVTFASPSAVRNFVAAVGTELAGAAVIAIGPVTADAVRAAGLPVAREAAQHTMAGLVAAVVAELGR